MSTVPSQPLTSDDRTWAVISHLSGLMGYVIPFFGNVLAPFVLWQVFKDKSAHVAREAKEALNFQITCSIMAMIAFALMLVMIGVFLLPVVGVFQVVFMIIAAIKASEGRPYRYPLVLRLLSDDSGAITQPPAPPAPPSVMT